MHWLIPSVSHSVSCLSALAANTLTPATALVSVAIAASQSIHMWAGVYGLFTLYFMLGTCITALAQRLSNGRSPTSTIYTRTAAPFLANFLVLAALVPLHQYYMQLRMADIPWFHIFRAPAGCLPVPSRSLTSEFQGSYTFVDALANQLPFGIAVSYAIATANAFSASFGIKYSNGRLVSGNSAAGAVGAFIISLTAAYILPMCDDHREGTHEVMMHVDRATAWEERTNMTWSMQARYGTFVASMTLAGTAGAIMIERLVGSGAPAKRSPVANGKQASSSKGKDAAGETQSVQNGGIVSSHDVMAVGTHVAAVSSVVVGMAVWSFFI